MLAGEDTRDFWTLYLHIKPTNKNTCTGYKLCCQKCQHEYSIYLLLALLTLWVIIVVRRRRKEEERKRGKV